MNRLDEIKTRERGATKGGWAWYNGCSWWRLGLADDQTKDAAVICPHVARDGQPTLRVSSQDREFIAEARHDIPWLISEVERLRAMICTFALDQAWAADTWKRQPHIAALFDEANNGHA